MTLIAVDIGNSLIKAAVADSDQPINQAAITWTQFHKWNHDDDFSLSDSAPATWLIASVSSTSRSRLTDWIQRHRPDDRLHILRHADIPIVCDIEAPELVGIDRLCGAVAAVHRVGSATPVIVIGCGTAITIDVVDARGHFLGGTISLGVRGSLQQLAQRTDQLPDLSQTAEQWQLSPIGKNTEQAIASGVLLSLAAGIDEIVRRQIDSIQSEARVLITGGDARLIAPLLRRPTEWVEHLVLEGVLLSGMRQIQIVD